VAKYKRVISLADTNDLAEYDRLAKYTKDAGLGMLGCGELAEITEDQRYNPDDSWLQFLVVNTGIMKYVETELVNGVLSKSHIAKNAALLAEKSRVLARHGMKGMLRLMEPQILPESFYAKHPDVRGARCDNPCISLADYFAPCLDHPKVLGHYREATRRVLETAPEIGAIYIWTNDSGAGICWCSGLYPGPNGPEACKETAMGVRIRKWMEAIIAGARDAGREIEVFFHPVHFSKDEVHSTIDNLPKGARVFLQPTVRVDHVNRPFIDSEAIEYFTRSAERRRGAVLGVDPTLGYPLGPVIDPPLPYFAFELLREAKKSGAQVLAAAGLRAPAGGDESAVAMAVKAALKKTPRNTVEVDAAVARIAKAQVGARLAPALVSAWRDVDRAFSLWPVMGDTNHMMYVFYSIMGNRWLTRPLVPVNRLLTKEEKAHYQKYSREVPGGLDGFFIAEGTSNYKIDELKWPVALYDDMMLYLNRATAELESAFPMLDREDDGARRRFMRQYRRVAMLRAAWRTQRNVYRVGSIIEFFTGEKQDEYWHVVRKDESFYEPPTYRRFFLEAVDDEIVNCREVIKLMLESDVPLLAMGEVEDRYVLGPNLVEQLDKKIAVMEAHKKDIDVLFPNCPPEKFADPTYEWADWRHGGNGKRRCGGK